MKVSQFSSNNQMKTDKVKTWKSFLKIEAAIKTKTDVDCILFA